MTPAWWLEEPYPKTTTGKDLVNENLVLDPERPPEDTKFPGMKNVFVKIVNKRLQPKSWAVYKVLMTERDITTAIDAMIKKKSFTFREGEHAKYPSVEIEE